MPDSSLRIAIIGAGGRLGAALARRYADRFRLARAFARADLDLADAEAVRRVLRELDFDVLVNTAAITNVDYCEGRDAEAMAVNAAAPEAMAQVCADKGARLLHVSTDYVFGGHEPGLRTEEDPAEPLGAYGGSKLAGERRALAACGDAMVVRTSWVFGPDRVSFLDSIIQRSIAGEGQAAIADKFSTPCYSEDFAELLEPLLAPGGPAGLLHLCNDGACSWQEYGQRGIDAATAAGIAFKTRQLGSLQLDEMDAFTAPRPRHTAMSTAKYAALTGKTPRPWEDAVDAYVRGRAWR